MLNLKKEKAKTFREEWRTGHQCAFMVSQLANARRTRRGRKELERPFLWDQQLYTTTEHSERKPSLTECISTHNSIARSTPVFYFGSEYIARHGKRLSIFLSNFPSLSSQPIQSNRNLIACSPFLNKTLNINTPITPPPAPFTSPQEPPSTSRVPPRSPPQCLL